MSNNLAILVAWRLCRWIRFARGLVRDAALRGALAEAAAKAVWRRVRR